MRSAVPSAQSIAVACVGDASSPAAWSGIPYYFWRAGQRLGVLGDPIRLDLGALRWPRRRWAIGRLARARRPSGYQYSKAFLDRCEAQVPPSLLAGEIISFNQHFPRAETVQRCGGRISYYIDATFAALSSARGLDLHLPPDVVAEARQLERENYRRAERVIAMARWTAASAIEDCQVDESKVFTVLPGANIELPDDWTPPPAPAGRPGIDRPFVLGFIGKDWQRKGLPLLCDVRDRLAQQGWKAAVRAIGNAPKELLNRPGLQFLGYIDKSRQPERFVKFLGDCDVGCLFSAREALGISTLEFLRAGVPVAGFAHEGPADTIPSNAGFRFDPAADVSTVAASFAAYLSDEAKQERFRSAARCWSPLLTWDRCVGEIRGIFRTRCEANPSRLTLHSS